MNQNLLTAVEKSGEAFLSDALIGGKFVLRACIVNFHTSLGDVEALPLLVSRLGKETDAALRRERAVSFRPYVKALYNGSASSRPIPRAA